MGFGMPAQLVALTDGQSILLDKPILLLGRHPECDIQIDSRKVSRRHCCIAQVHDYLVVRDLGSTNGIRINGVRVVEGRIKPGDELTIGSHRYQVQTEDANGPAASTPRDANPPRGVGKPGGVNDDDLESCDEPIPLAESGRLLRPADAPLESPPLRPAPEVAPESPPLGVPEQVGLAPPSQAHPAPASPSHHPA
jgi:predicted component of type VI protein secretion system